jgi:hypothetical protein
MDRRTSPAQTPSPGDLAPGAGPGPPPCPGAETPTGPVLTGPVPSLGTILVKTVRHFWPEINRWLDEVPDTRFQPYVVYHPRFLIWWGLSLYLFQLGSRRQLDFDLEAQDTQVLTNLNRLAQTAQKTRPVHKTLDHFLGHTRAAPYATVRAHMLARLIRMKALDSARLQGRFVVALDATGHLCFRQRHCDHCLVQRHQTYTLYLHQVLEAKLLGPAGLALSMDSEFIENTDADAALSGDDFKQDCELKALSRLLPHLRQRYPQLPLCLAGDSLYACGRTLQLAQDYHCDFVLTFKQKHMSAVWADFQSLLVLCPQNTLACTTPDGVQQCYRWVHDLSYQDDQGRTHRFHAIECQETVHGQTTTFAWITSLKVNQQTVVDVATKGGRYRWHIENQGFQRQKIGGFNLEHVFSLDPENLKAYYYLLPIAHMILQVFEASSLLRRLADEHARATPAQLFGSLKNLARRLLECFRYFVLPDEAFERPVTARMQIRLDTS